jgi:hypothetical protein
VRIRSKNTAKKGDKKMADGKEKKPYPNTPAPTVKGGNGPGTGGQTLTELGTWTPAKKTDKKSK